MKLLVVALPVGLTLLAGCEAPGPVAIGFPVVRDTAYAETHYKKEHWLSTAMYPPLYLGPFQDTVILDHALRYRHSGSMPPLPADVCFIDWLDKREFRSPEPSDIKVIVDTTQLVAHLGENIRYDDQEPPYRAHPVMLVNQVKDTLYVGYGDYFGFILEARSETGQWLPIEQRFMYVCGNGVGSIVLPPGYLAITSVMIYEGDLPTECRLKFGEAYSNTFYASIDRQQFESRYDDQGNEKEEIGRVEQAAEFPGGQEALMTWLGKRLQYPDTIANVEGKVWVRFQIGADGKVSDVVIKRPLHPAFDAEVVRVIRSMPAWTPAKGRDGAPMACMLTLPVIFKSS